MGPNHAIGGDDRRRIAGELMRTFARRTGLAGGQAPTRRYLWTDAFAVCNFLALGDDASALRLIGAVHGTLGQFRGDDPRSGWLHGPHGNADEENPTRAGLRIGKPLPERAQDAPFDPQQEWDRDGQYFHYLTRWMHALSRTAVATERPALAVWAWELALAAYGGFVRRDGGGLRMVWKMSTDLSRPLVPSMGHHDPLDGWATTAMAALVSTDLGIAPPPLLDAVRDDYVAMLRGRDWTTTDPLGIGGVLGAVDQLACLVDRGVAVPADLAENLLNAALEGLQGFAAQFRPEASPATRLGFRELGLAIGLAVLEPLAATGTGAQHGQRLAALRDFVPLGRSIEEFWLQEANRRAPTWQDHLDINDVMLATALVPDGVFATAATLPA